MANNMTELGRSGLAEWSGVIQEDFLRDLHGKKGYKKFDEMRRNSAVVAALLNAIEQSVRSVDWQFTSENENDPRLDIINDSLDGMTYSMNDHISEALTMLPFGYSIFEIVYKRSGGRVLWRKFACRGQDTVYKWLFDDEGGIAGFVQQVKGDTIELPIEKLLLYRTKVEKNNPEGWSILRPAYPHYYYAKNLMSIEAIGIERDLNGMPVITLPAGADVDESDTNSDASKAAKIVRNVRMDEQMGIVLPSPDWKFELASTQSTRLWDTDAIISRHEKRMLMSALAQFLVLGMDKVGSMSLSTDQTDFFNMSVNAVADVIAETFTKFAIPRLMALNGYDAYGITLEHSPAGDVDISTVADFLQKTSPMINWTPEDEMWLRSLANLPAKSIEELQDIQDEKTARDQAMLANFNKLEQDQSNMSMLEAAPDKSKRMRFENKLQSALAKFWIGEGERILKGVKK